MKGVFADYEGDEMFVVLLHGGREQPIDEILLEAGRYCTQKRLLACEVRI